MELLNKLNKIHELKNEKIEEAFNEVAEEILYNYLLKINGNEYRITEIEFYLHCDGHLDPYVHKNKRQKDFKKWYFHRYKKSDKLKVGNYKGLDITFGKGKNCKVYGGILIRAIEKYDDTNKYTEGPCNVVNQILKVFKIDKNDKEEYRKFVEDVEKIGIFENNKINKKISLIYPSSSEKKNDKNDIVYKCPRKGLNIKSNSNSHWEEYVMKPYRYLLDPRKTTKERNLLTLGLIHEIHNIKIKNIDDVINKFNTLNINFPKFRKTTIERYESAYQFGYKLDYKREKKDLKSLKYPKCILYGLLNEGEKKMKKTLINILIIFIISNLYSIGKNENIELPKIPIYIEGDYPTFNHSYFKEVSTPNESIYNFQIVKKKSDIGASLGTRIFTILLGIVAGGYVGYLIGDNNEVPVIGSIIGAYSVGGSFALGFETTILNRLNRDVKIRTEYKLYLKKQNEKSDKLLDYKKERAGISYSFIGVPAGIIGTIVFGTGPALGYYYAFSSTQSDVDIPLKSNDLDIMFSKTNLVKKDYLNLLEKIKIYNQPFIKPNFSVKEKNKLNNFIKPKNEFETTKQYQERIVREQIKEKEKITEYEQKVKIAQENQEIMRYTLLQEIKEEISEIEFTKSYDFKMSNYNADKQSFFFNITGVEKKIVVPIANAPAFKENVSNFSVQKIFKPTLNGIWVAVNDDYVLINTKTDEIIPWEGEIPIYVETAVENPPILSASVKLIEPSGEGYLDAEETAIIKVTLTNSGKGTAKKTRISLFQQKGSTLYYDVSNTINEILSNQSITYEFKLTVPENIESGNVEFKISFLEEQGFEPSPLTFTAQTRAMLKPDLHIVDFGVDDANRDGKISKGETADITIRIQNKGQGKAKNVSLDVAEDRLVNVFIISEKHFELGNLESGESKDITFTISTNKRVSDVVNINFNIREKRPKFSIEDTITLELEKTQKQLKPIVFVGKDVKTEIIDVTDLSIDIEQDIPQSSKTNENALAIIFGIERYKNVSSVTHATRDANFVKEYLNKTIGIKESNIYHKTNDDVGKAEFDKVFSKGGWLDKRVKEGKTEIYFYYAGHGAPDIKQNKAYLIPYDGDPNYASQTGYELGKLYSNLADLGAKSVTVFLDACFSGANRESEMLLADARPIFIVVEGPAAHGITVFSATSSKEISSAWPEKKHGLFSYFLMKGLQGEADLNNDNKLSIKELGDYIQQNVSERAGFLDREQTPQLITDDENRILINY